MSIGKIFIAVLTIALMLVCSCSKETPRESASLSPAITSFLNAADTLKDTVMVIAVNDRPDIISSDMVKATGGIYFKYIVQFVDPDGPVAIIEYRNYPDWLTSDADSLYGTPPDGLSDTGFTVFVSDGSLEDSLMVTIRIIPCLLVYGDTRTNHNIHQQIVDLILPHQPSTVFHSGDLVNNGNSSSDWDTFNTITSQLRLMFEFYPALGNHEYQSQLYFDNFDLPNNEQWYSVERNYIRFIILNSCVATNIGSEQYQWLETNLASVPDSVKFIAAVFHHPPYSTGPHTEDEMSLRQTFIPLFEQYGVDIVFNGHDHDYERSYCGGIYYIVTGGGGAPLYDQARTHPCSQLFLKTYHFCKLSSIGDSLIVKVYDNSSQLIDQFTLEKTTRHSTSHIRLDQ
jgi:predicted phosphodiesterase